MIIKVKDVLTFGGLKNAKLVAGAGGIENEVESISVLEVAESAIGRWVLKNQLYITSFYAIHSNVEMQKIVIKTLVDSKCCGLVLCHINLWVKNIHPEVIDLCNQLNFPLIVADSDVSYVEILNPIIERLMKINMADTQLMLSAQNKLIDIVATNDQLEDIFRSITSVFKSEISFYDLDNKCIFANCYCSSVTISKIENFLKDSCYSLFAELKNNSFTTKTIDGKSWIIYPIKAVGVFYGFVVVLNSFDSPEIAQNLIKNIAKMCTLIYTKKSRLKELQEIYVQNYISDLITWNFRNDDVAIKSGLDLGWDIRNKSYLVIININSIQEYLFRKEVKDIQNYVKKYLYPLIVEEVKSFNPKNLIGYRSDMVFILIERDKKLDEENIETVTANRILKLCSEHFQGSVSIGISDYISDYTRIPTSYVEATNAAILGRKFFGENKVTKYSDLGFLMLLKEMKKTKNTDMIIDYLLQPLIEYDRLNYTTLVKTFECLLENNMDATRVSEALFVHKNTVNYRKGKIIEILGKNPFEMPHLINYLLAYTLQKL
ncbi:MAG: PucR family transcriptional regulator [Tepidanaerobacteraceae bacterium]|jgi:purine catabolism regulator